jgi:delta-aminolevulinic acid dehydratase/porphobilinogen synthase
MSERDGKYSETTNTAAGITTPSGQEDIAPEDMLSGVVEEVMNNIQDTLHLEDDKDTKK